MNFIKSIIPLMELILQTKILNFSKIFLSYQPTKIIPFANVTF
jgi:hypothetical protein